ncbi:Macrophage mannose receptor 1-like isoform X3 [Oopsacas minuta]|uniref:Macrophage mannose receptor 1-like isoform X3 n=1 Tax=Oopsacas minuta TaxID=111878 RepID=A0AAV7KJX3_9METZ|nr:Macrophage mannose receptor 1-like isoform X3 [Oopsacas minuta]
MILVSYIQIQTAQDPVREITFNNSTFAIFTTIVGSNDTHISWTYARDVCKNWGGNLATIKSKQEDTLFYYLTNINEYFGSWIGLNDRGMGNEAGTDANSFRWEDGSDSTYRQFATTPEEEAYPRATNDNFDCVSFRYRRGQGLSNGWHDRQCGDGSTVFSYFCQRPGISNGCDLIYENFCYQIFTASEGISWYDAQSTCSVWGGDLTSVPLKRVNNFLYTIIPDTTSKYWIGLYDDNGDESFNWIDGTQVRYTNYVSNAPNDFNSMSCITMETDGKWNNYDCGDNINNYICRRNSNFIAVYGLLRELTYDDSTFAIFTTFPKISWTAAQDSCISWGGNLTTIKSQQEDTLLYYLTDINLYFASWIGLNDRTNEANTNSNLFVWVDGSDNNYRQFATSPESEVYPRAETEESDCVSFRYNRLNRLSNGWHDRNCDAAVFSYYCQKSATSNGCDLTYEGFCFRVFEESDARINWFDAQSTCSVWGGDLTSVPSERMNNFLYTIVLDTTNKYWIGLYDDNGDESFNWIDGTQVRYTNYVSNAPNDFNSMSCIAMETDGKWNNYDCGNMNDFICKRDSNDITELDVMRNLTYDDSTFAIFTTFPKISWTAAQDSCISWGGNLTTIKSQQEDTLLYYLTDINLYFASWIGLNDRTNEANTNSNLFVWVDGSDNNYRQFATSPESEVYPRAETVESDCVSFRYNRLNGLSNGWHDRNCDAAVFSYYCQKLATSNGCDLIYEETCYRAFEHTDGISWFGAQNICTIWGGDLTSIPSERVNNFLYTIVPDTISKYWIGLYDENGDESFNWIDGTQVSYTNYLSNAPKDFNSGSCVVMKTDGKWKNVNCANRLNDFICRRSHNYITGYTTPNFISTLTEGIIQNGSVLSPTEDTITISCTVSNPIYGVEWYYRSLIDNEEINKTSLSRLSTNTGISSLNISSNQHGYYSCIINTDSVYSVYVVNSSSLISVTSLDNPSQQIDYTVGSTTSMLYYSVSDISDSSLRWTTDTISNGDSQEYSNEYTNPIDLSIIFSDVGAGVQTLSCFYRMSPVTLLGSLQIAIRGNKNVFIQSRIQV